VNYHMISLFTADFEQY